MARHKDTDWSLNDAVKTWGECQLSVLMDIRDELKALNEYNQSWRLREYQDAVKRIDKRLQVNGLLLNKKRRRKKRG